MDAWSCGSCFTSYLCIVPNNEEVVKLVTDLTVSSEAPFVCRRSRNPSQSASRPFLCPDSGATADLFWDRRLFDDDSYESLVEQYVEMGDGSRVPIAGRGTVSFLMGGHSVCLSDCLHVTDLDVHLLSIRVHRRRGSGCTFLADDAGMFLTFPTFVIKVDDHVDTLIPAGSRSAGHLGPPEFCDTSGSIVYSRGTPYENTFPDESSGLSTPIRGLSELGGKALESRGVVSQICQVYRSVSPTAATKHDCKEYYSQRCESKVEANHDHLAHFANCGMRVDLCDILNLIGTAQYNTKIRHRLRMADWAKGMTLFHWVGKHITTITITRN